MSACLKAGRPRTDAYPTTGAPAVHAAWADTALRDLVRGGILQGSWAIDHGRTMEPATPQANLDQLCSEIQGMHPGLSSRPGSLSNRLASGMPLSHATGLDPFEKICGSGSLLSLARRHAVEPLDWSDHPVEVRMNTRDCVFLFAGPFRYPCVTACGFLFKPGLENARAADGAASPFDSGGLVNHHRPPDNEDPLAFLQRHEMPIPDYRRYFMLVLDLLFEDPLHYLEGRDPVRPGPVRLEVGDSDARRWTFEVRLRDELPIRPALQALFVSKTAAGMSSVVETCSWCRANGVDIVRYASPRGRDRDNFVTMQRKSIAYIRRRLVDGPG